MLTFNNNNIFTGYLKQLLSSFNLPQYRVYSMDNIRYHEWAVKKRQELKEQGVDEKLWPPLEKDILQTIIPVTSTGIKEYPENLRYALYIKDGEVQKYSDDTWEILPNLYHENKKELNKTKTLKIKNNIYDSYTHEYLGNFLRFIRDYYDIDLMPLYNCFSNTLCPNLLLKLITPANTVATFDTRDSAYKIYMLPVKLFKKYTIAIDSASPVEVCCGFYGAYQDKRDKLKYISDFTYKKYNMCQFNNPLVYDMITSDYLDPKTIEYMELAQNEDNLKLFIKLPAANTSSIVVLEGDYSGYNNFKYAKDPKTNLWKFTNNHTINNYAKYNEITDAQGNVIARNELPDFEHRKLNPITNLQLLKLNTGTSYPFADRLIEYLSGNAITSNDPIEDNIKRVQTILSSWNIIPKVYGSWDAKMKFVIYDYMSTKTKLSEDTQHDILGYVDKDTEKHFLGNTAKLPKATSISNIYIYPELYKESQKK